MAADLILTNGIVYTVDAARSRHEAVAVADGRIAAVGTAAEVGELAGPRTRVVDLGGRLLLPGFVDSHMHASSATEDLFDVSLVGLHARSRECVDRRGALRGRAPGAPVHPRLRLERHATCRASVPAAADLDAVVADRPVILHDDSYHSVWLNSAGLQLAGHRRAPRPTRTTASSSASTTGRRPGRCARVPAYVADAGLPDLHGGAGARGHPPLHARRWPARNGLTTVQDAGLRPGRDAALEAYELLQAAGELTTRFCLSIWFAEDRPLEAQIAAAVAERARHTGPLVSAAWAKLFPDGVIEGHTAYLKEPYADQPGFCGEPLWTPRGA